jgi:hypothetical protein
MSSNGTLLLSRQFRVQGYMNPEPYWEESPAWDLKTLKALFAVGHQHTAMLQANSAHAHNIKKAFTSALTADTRKLALLHS